MSGSVEPRSYDHPAGGWGSLEGLTKIEIEDKAKAFIGLGGNLARAVRQGIPVRLERLRLS